MSEEINSDAVNSPIVRAIKDQKDHIEVIIAPERTWLAIAAIHKDRSRNLVHTVSCKKGIPIGGYVYDAQSDSYIFDCADYFPLGYLPVSVILKGKDSSWEMRIPMAETVIRKFMTNLQRRELKNFKNHFKNNDYRHAYIQMIEPN